MSCGPRWSGSVSRSGGGRERARRGGREGDRCRRGPAGRRGGRRRRPGRGGARRRAHRRRPGAAGHDEGWPRDLPVPRQRPGACDRGLGTEVPRHRQERRRELGAHLLPAAGPHRGVGHVGAAPDRGLDRFDPGRAVLAGRGRGGTRGPAGRVADRDRGQQPVARSAVIGAIEPAATAAQRRARAGPARGRPGDDRRRPAALLREHRPRGHRQRPRDGCAADRQRRPVVPAPGPVGLCDQADGAGRRRQHLAGDAPHGHGRDRHRRRPPVLRERDRFGPEPAHRAPPGGRRRARSRSRAA